MLFFEIAGGARGQSDLDCNSGITTYYKGVTVESVCSSFEIAYGSCGQSVPDGDVDITTKEPLKTLLRSFSMSFMPRCC